MGDLGERVGLIHELRQLRRSEELSDGGHDRLRIDQVVRHRRRHFLVDGHLLLDRSLHPDQPDAKLVLEQLAHGPDAPIAEVIDIIHVGRVFPEREQVRDHLVEVLRVQDPLVERRVQVQLGVELQATHAREVVFLRVEEQVLEQRPRALARRRIAGPQAPVDLDERFLVRADGILLQRLRDDRPDVVTLREEDLDLLDPRFLRDRNHAGRDLLVGLEHDLARGRVDHVGGRKGPLELRVRDLDGLDARRAQGRDGRVRDLLAGPDHEVGTPRRDLLGRTQPDQAVLDRPVQRSPSQGDPVDRIERPDDLVGAPQAERPQKHGPQELPFAIDPHMQEILGVVLELDPRAPVRNDLSDVEGPVFRMEKGAGRPMELRHDDPFSAVDDERAGVGHQRHVAEVHLLLLDVPDRLDTRVRVLIPHDQADRDLQGDRVGHAMAFVDVVLQLQRHGVPTHVAHVTAGVVGVPAPGAQHLVLPVRIGHYGRPTALARLAQVMQPGQPAALALPIPDRVLDELERRVLAEVADGEHRFEHRLQTRVLPLGGQAIHLEEALVRLPLNLDQVRNRNRRPDLGEIDPLAIDVAGNGVHA